MGVQTRNQTWPHRMWTEARSLLRNVVCFGSEKGRTSRRRSERQHSALLHCRQAAFQRLVSGQCQSPACLPASMRNPQKSFQDTRASVVAEIIPPITIKALVHLFLYALHQARCDEEGFLHVLHGLSSFGHVLGHLGNRSFDYSKGIPLLRHAFRRRLLSGAQPGTRRPLRLQSLPSDFVCCSTGPADPYSGPVWHSEPMHICTCSTHAT